ncbi:MAG: tetratricopeptide repeat protein [Candidatus Muiribacteriaceae bacterium]
MKKSNFEIAYRCVLKDCSREQVLFLVRQDLNRETGFLNILDIFVYSPGYDVFEWMYGFESAEDPDIIVPEETFIMLCGFFSKIFPDYTQIICSDMDLPDYFGDVTPLYHETANEEEVFSRFPVFISEENDRERRKKIYLILKAKIQQFLNFMDTDSIPFYFHNIAVIYNELELHRYARFYLHHAIALNNNSLFRNELIITLTRQKEFVEVLKMTEDSEDLTALKSRAYALRMTGRKDEALTLYRELVNLCDEDWIADDLRSLEDDHA